MKSEDSYVLPSAFDDRRLDEVHRMMSEPAPGYRSAEPVSEPREEGIAWEKIVRDHYQGARCF